MATSDYTTAGTFTWICPAGVVHVTAECWGGGAGSSGSGGVGGASAGAGGAYAVKDVVTVVPGTGYTVVVGDGGPGGAGQAMYSYGYNNGAGGDSYFITVGTVMAKGGPANTKTAAAASASVGDRKFAGGNGGSNVTNPCGAGGGSSGGTASTGANGNNSPQNCTGGLGGTAPSGGGNGGRGGVAATNANNSAGFQPGGGGGGPCRGGPPGRTGTNGGVGRVLLTYVATLLLSPSKVSGSPSLFAPTVVTSPVQVLSPGPITHGPGPFAPAVTTPGIEVISPTTIGLAPSLAAPALSTPSLSVLSPALVSRAPSLSAPALSTPSLSALSPALVSRAPSLSAPALSTIPLLHLQPSPLAQTPLLFSPGVSTLDTSVVQPMVFFNFPVLFEPSVTTTFPDLLAPRAIVGPRSIFPPLVFDLSPRVLRPSVLHHPHALIPPRVQMVPRTLPAPTAIVTTPTLYPPFVFDVKRRPCWTMTYDANVQNWLLKAGEGELIYTLSRKFRPRSTNRFDVIVRNTLGIAAPQWIDVVPATQAVCDCSDADACCWSMYYDTVNARWILDGNNGAVVYTHSSPFDCQGDNSFNVLLSGTVSDPPAAVIARPYGTDCHCCRRHACCNCKPDHLCATWYPNTTVNVCGYTGAPSPVHFLMERVGDVYYGLPRVYVIDNAYTGGFQGGGLPLKNFALRPFCYCEPDFDAWLFGFDVGYITSAGTFGVIGFTDNTVGVSGRFFGLAGLDCDDLRFTVFLPDIPPRQPFMLCFTPFPARVDVQNDLTPCTGHRTLLAPGGKDASGRRPVSGQRSRSQVQVPCVHLGVLTGETVRCQTCQGNVQIKLNHCEVYGVCSRFKKLEGLSYCGECPSYERPSPVASV